MLSMYSNKNILYIISGISAIEKIAIYTYGFSNSQEFLQANDLLNFNGTITLLIAIAEEAKKIEKNLLEIQPDIKWQNIVDMRNVLAHDYRGVDPEIVFDVVRSELPKLREAFLHILKVFPEPFVMMALETPTYLHLKKIISD